MSLTPKDSGGRSLPVFPVRIDHSALFDGASDCLSFTPSAAGDRQKWTVSFWFKPVNAVECCFFSAGVSGERTELYYSGNRFYFFELNGSGAQCVLWSTHVFTDFTGHAHFMVAVDTTLAAAADRVKMYVNGVRLANFAAGEAHCPQNYSTAWNNAVPHAIGEYVWDGSRRLPMYLSDFYVIDGQAYPPSVFGEFSDQVTGLWIPKDPGSLDYGANGCRLEFADADDLGKDSVLPATKPVIGSVNIFTGGASGGPYIHGQPPSRLFDGGISAASKWYAPSSTAENYAYYILPEAKVMASYFMSTYSGSGATAWPYGWDILGSNDTTNGVDGVWELVDSQRNQTQFAGYSRSSAFVCSNPGLYKAYKWVFRQGNYPSVNSLATWHGYELIGHTSPNSWTVHGSPVQTADTPTDNFATLNPLNDFSVGAFFDGNLKVDIAQPQKATTLSTLLVNEKMEVYAEFDFTGTTGGNAVVGIGKQVSRLTTDDFGGKADDYTLLSDTGQLYNNGALSDIGVPSYAAGDQIDLHWIGSTGSLNARKNNDPWIQVATGLTGEFCLGVGSASDSGSATWAARFGATGYVNAPPSGSTVFSTSARPDPAVLKSSTVADIVLRQGEGEQKFSVTGAPGETASSGSYAGTNPNGGFTVAVDYPSNAWLSDTPHTGWLRYMFSSARRLEGYALVLPTAVHLDNSPQNFTFEGSQDGASWTILDTQTGVVWSSEGERKDFTVSEPGAYKCYRLNITASRGGERPGIGCLYGLGDTSIDLSNMDGGPDCLQTKARTASASHGVVDAARGDDKVLYTDLTASEQTETDLVSLTSAGYSLGGPHGIFNESGTSFVDLCLKAGAAQGFEIVTYTGDGAAGRQIAHNLGKAPTFIIVKCTSSGGTSWVVYHVALGATKAVLLESASPAQTSAVFWDNTEPSSTTFTLGATDSINRLNDNYVAYLFTDSDIFRAFSYTGNGSADGPFVSLGGRPLAIPFMKDTANAVNWVSTNSGSTPFNPIDQLLHPSLSNAETFSHFSNYTSSGFKLVNGSAAWNAAGALHVGLAILESTKYSNAY